MPGFQPFEFVFDTGADYSVIPMALALSHRIVFQDGFSADSHKETEDGPRTRTGRLKGYWDHFTLRCHGKHRVIPCFIEVPAVEVAVPEPDPHAPDQTKRVLRDARDLAEWLHLTEELRRTGTIPPSVRPSLLGTIGFLDAFNVLIQEDHLYISKHKFKVKL